MAKAWQIQSVGCPNDSRHLSHQSTTLHLRFSFKLFWHFGFALPAKPMFLRILWIVVSRHWSWLPLLTPSCYVRWVLAIVNIQLSTWGCQQSQVSQAPMSGLLVFSFFLHVRRPNRSWQGLSADACWLWHAGVVKEARWERSLGRCRKSENCRKSFQHVRESISK